MLLWCDSFSTYTDLTTRYNGDANGWWIPNSPTAARFDTAGMLLSPFNNTKLNTFNLGNKTTMTLGAALYIPLASGNSVNIGMLLGFWDGATVQTNISMTGSFTVPGSFQAQRNGTNIGSPSAAVFTFNAWHYIELQVTFNGTTGAVTLKLDGNTVLSLTGVNTIATANAYANAAFIGGNVGIWWDDFYVADTTGSVNNSFLGEIKVSGSLPTGNGTQMDYSSNVNTWTANAVMTKDLTISDGTNLQRVSAVTSDAKTGATAPTWNSTLNGTTTDNHVTWTNIGTLAAYKLVNGATSDDDSSYVADGIANDQARFTFASATGSAVKGVMLFARVRKDDMGVRAFRFVAKSASSQADNGTDLTVSTTWQNWSTIFENDPATGGAWTPPALNAAEFGIKTV